MQHYIPIKLWTVIAAKTVVHNGKAANMRRYIAADYIMLHNVAYIYHIMLHNFAPGERSFLGITICSYLLNSQPVCINILPLILIRPVCIDIQPLIGQFVLLHRSRSVLPPTGIGTNFNP